MLKQVVHVPVRHRACRVLLANICVLLEHKVTSHIPDFLVLLSGSLVSIATRYGLEGSGSNLGGGEIFRAFQTGPWPTHHPLQWMPVLSRGKAAGHVVDHLPYLATKLKK